jgi:hypothetical protein
MHEPHRYPHLNRPSPQGRISITIGKIAVGRRRDKAHPCHLRGTEVIGRGTASYVTQEGRLKVKSAAQSSMGIGIFRFSGLAWGWNYDSGKIAFCSQFPEGRQITELQVIPAAE